MLGSNGPRVTLQTPRSSLLNLGGGVEQFLDREVERYRPQLQRYARLASRLGQEPVRLGLYFPLMGAWREWAP